MLLGCPVGRLTQNPDVLADPTLHAPVAETFDWLCAELPAVLAEGIAAVELSPALHSDDTAATLQGGYVLARAAGSRDPFDRAVQGALSLLKAATP
ncbi:hypothetical protein AB0J72_47555 [Dactylosporangium sp. NPDC049742]|uniref:hypothetical protein n=1 Tax=Dactylosporangium sp. NPDC049742 TaxID=3154737 RepID=UPI003436245C